jgi:outer membrane protein assembly factor BamD (BamD/ComL family)
MLHNGFTYAWLAFGHSFSMEKEYDQAIAAYNTVARLFPGYAKMDFVYYMFKSNLV